MSVFLGDNLNICIPKIFSGSGCKAIIKMIDVVAIITQVAGIAVPMAVHAMELGEYKWLVSDAPKVRIE